ncbi:hypothetical protein BGZ88_008468 [Linnemannia elongata]|nr:hypothetical protein BGZ88_008468 [Linnemannia elongata]
MTKNSDSLDSAQPDKNSGAFRKFLGLKSKDKTSNQPSIQSSSQQATSPPPPPTLPTFAPPPWHQDGIASPSGSN